MLQSWQENQPIFAQHANDIVINFVNLIKNNNIDDSNKVKSL